MGYSIETTQIKVILVPGFCLHIPVIVVIVIVEILVDFFSYIDAIVVELELLGTCCAHGGRGLKLRLLICGRRHHQI